MTLRLILVGLVAALGLTIPQRSNHKARTGLAQAGTTGAVGNRNINSLQRTGRNAFATRRTFYGPTSINSRRVQPTALASSTVRPSRKAATNFWQVPSGPRNLLKAPTISSKPIVAKTVQKSFEPIEVAQVLYAGVSEGLNRGAERLAAEVQRLSASLKAKKPINLPIEPSDGLNQGLALSLNRRSEGLGRLGPIPNRMPLANFRPLRSIEPGMDVYDAIEANLQSGSGIKTQRQPIGAGPEAVAPAASSLNLLSMGSLLIQAQGVVVNLCGQVEQMRRMAWESAKAIRMTLPGKEPKTAIVAALPTQAELANFPDDLFALEIREQVVQTTPPAPSIDFPDDVFAAQTPVAPEVVVAEALKPAHARDAVVASRPTDRPGEPSTISSPALGSSGTELGTDHLTNAVSLTRDAAVAWMKLLSGPAVVTLNR